jgi:hypothetical protein
MRKELAVLTGKLGLTATDIIRGALFFGLPIFAVMNDLQDSLMKRFVDSLKKAARKKRQTRRLAGKR